MRQTRTLAAMALLCAAACAHAEHFQYRVDLTGSYSVGGAEGCAPPDFDQPACPREGSLAATFSFDTPGRADASWLIAAGFGDIVDFRIDLGSLADGPLFGGVNVTDGIPNGSVQTADGLEMFTFDGATRTASWDYDYLDHNPWGHFTGTLSAVPEPGTGASLLAALGAMLAASRWCRAQPRPQASKSGFSKPGLA